MKIVMGENLVYQANVQVGSHHYARLFARDNKVLWLSIPWNIFVFLKYGKKGDRYSQFNNGKFGEIDGIQTWCPFTLVPYRDNFPFRSVKNIKRTLKYSIPNLRKKLRLAGFDQCDILWITDPRMMYLCDLIKYKKLIYRCVDDLKHFKGIPDNIIDAEKELVRKADIVFVTADTLKERLLQYGNNNIYSLPNAVDYTYFANYSIENRKCILDDLKNIILYVGTIGEWFDCEMIRFCAEKRPEYQFVLIGPQRTDVFELSQLKNVHLLGAIPYSDVPLYMKKSDIGVIPFKVNKLVDAVNPLKLYEYFACGLPVVATSSYELEKMNSPAQLYKNYAEAVAMFDELLEKNSCEEINERKKFACVNSWEARYAFILSHIQ